jgi:large subunit ribosomal protein LP1
MPTLTGSDAELAVSYAALILADDDVAITADKIKDVLSAANCDVPAYWPSLYAKVLAGRDVNDIIMSAGAAPAASGAAPAAAAGAGADAAEEKKAESEAESRYGYLLWLSSCARVCVCCVDLPASSVSLVV